MGARLGRRRAEPRFCERCPPSVRTGRLRVPDAATILAPGSIPQRCETKMLGWFRALMPKEQRFFHLFQKHAALVVSAAESLRALLQGGAEIELHCRDI